MFNVEPSVPANVSELLIVAVFPLAIESVPVVVVIVSPLIDVAVATPRTGVTRVGLVEKTKLVEVVPVVPAAVNPVILLKQVMDADEQFVPPLAIGNISETSAVREIAE